MKKYILLFVIGGMIFTTSCSSDKTAEKGEISEKEVESMVDEMLEEELSNLDEGEGEGDEAVVNEVEVELEEVNVDKEAELAMKKEIKKEQLKESPNLGKDCEAIYKEYSKMVDDYLAGKDQENILKKLANWANDPIFNKCKKDPAYVDKFFELEEKMYAEDDEEL